jgi:hypothetical protein
VAKLVRDLLPLAVVTAIAGIVTLWLLTNNPSVGQWVLAAILLAHGWVHAMFLFPRPDPATAKPGAPSWPFDLSTSWLVTRGGVATGAVVGAGKALVAFTFAASMLAALATLGWLVPAAWWAGLVLASAGGSALLLMVCFAPTLVIGLAIDIALAWLALAGPWQPGAP